MDTRESLRQEFILDLRESLKMEAEVQEAQLDMFEDWKGRDPYEPKVTQEDLKKAHSLLNGLSEDKEYTFDDVDDMVYHPKHYKQGGMEAIDVMKAFVPDFHSYCMGNVIKYVLRHLQKNGKQDLNKALWYLEVMIEEYDRD